MGLIKSPHPLQSRTAFSLKDIEAEAALLLAQARQEAEEIRLAAHATGLAQGRQDGLAQGLAEGKQAGRDQALAEARERLTQLVQSLAQTAAALDAGRRQLEAQGLTEVIALAATIARRVTKRQGIVDPQVLLANLGEAMKLAVSSADIRIGLHPSQIALLQSALPDFLKTWPHLQHVELIEDAAIAPGGCRIFTCHGQVDADLNTQLDRVIDALCVKPPLVAAGVC